MIKVGGGAIVNTASVAGLAGTNFHAYSASKGGMIALSRSIATTYAPQNIRSNVICPGFIETPMTAEISGSQRLLQAYLESTPLHKAGKPLDIAYMALYLASDEAAFVTGGVFVVDGGVMAR
jgi:NAD(P)-dependent dehydrogenase (short-subunit alcohol dehydrogenase family)